MLFLLHKICYTDSKQGREIVPMKRVLITGGSGFLGARIRGWGMQSFAACPAAFWQQPGRQK